MSYGVEPSDILTLLSAGGALIRIGIALIPVIISLF